MSLTKRNQQSKLELLAQTQGYYDPMELLEEYVTDSVCPGICVNPDCDYTTEVEPDCTRGYCECCNTNTVQSAMILAGVI